MIKKLKTLSVLSLLFTSIAAHATGEGLYLGLQFGNSNIHNRALEIQAINPPPTSITITPTNTGMGFRFYLGYQISSWAAIEGGLTSFAKSSYKTTVNITCNSPSISEKALDIQGKGSIPMGKFNVFAKAGMALLTISQSGSLNPPQDPNSLCGPIKNKTTSVRPIVGVGTSFDFTQNWVAELTWAHIMKGSGTRSADLISLGITYHYVDLMCGQFLC